MKRNYTRSWTITRFAGLGLAITAMASGCGGSGGGAAAPPIDLPPPPPPPTFAAVDVYVAHNGTDNSGTIDRLDEDLQPLAMFNAGNNQGMVIDLSDNLYVAGDGNAPPGNLRVINRFDGRPDAAAFDGQRDREVPATGSISLRGVAIAHRAGLLFAANNQGSSIEVYGTAAGESALPIASAVIANEPHDVAYDEAADRLFIALTNGTIEVIDDFVGSGFSTATSRSIAPDGAVSLSGIAHDAGGDRLVVTDVGVPGVVDDGKVFVISSASTASGSVTPFRSFAGPATQLGDPVDVVLKGSDVRIAENANDLILAYTNIFNRVGGDVAADLAVTSIKPQSLALGPTTGGAGALADVTDLDDVTQFTTTAIAAVSNPASASANPDLVRLSPALDQVMASLDSGTALENIVFTQTGDALVTFDDGSNQNGGIYVLNRAAIARDGETANESRDRIIRGAATGLVSPKGVDVDDARGLIFVAENNATTPSIRVFGAEASGDVAPLFAAALTARPWDLDYDSAADRLYVAQTDGTIAVFDAFVANAGVNPPDRVITPRHSNGTGTELAINLHGIVHVSGTTDTLIVSDIGSASLDSDGKIFVLAGASAADGITDVSIEIDNDSDVLLGATMLGNPVDLAFDGSHLYVAEKSGNAVLRFDDILASAGGNVAPGATISQDAAESVAVIPDYLAREPGTF